MTPVGILGGGQLARMIALAGHPLGLRCRVLDPAADPPAAAVAEHVRGALDDPDAIARFASGLEVVTCEIEHVSDLALERVAGVLRPGAQAIRVARDRLAEKRFLVQCGIPIAGFRAVDDERDLERAASELGFPMVLKRRTHGYDGRGQAVVRSAAEAAAAFAALGPGSLVAEALVSFDRELSVTAARSAKGELALYPVVENLHVDGILRRTTAPAPEMSAVLAERIGELVRSLLSSLDYVGVLTVELFQIGERILVNEIAPRVHNSGHWTLEGAETDQFENHLRAILGLPLGSTACTDDWVMFNVIGEAPDLQQVLEVPGAHLHLYGKDPRPGRKLGHVSCRASHAQELRRRLEPRLGLAGEKSARSERPETNPEPMRWT